MSHPSNKNGYPLEYSAMASSRKSSLPYPDTQDSQMNQLFELSRSYSWQTPNMDPSPVYNNDNSTQRSSFQPTYPAPSQPSQPAHPAPPAPPSNDSYIPFQGSQEPFFYQQQMPPVPKQMNYYNPTETINSPTLIEPQMQALNINSPVQGLNLPQATQAPQITPEIKIRTPVQPDPNTETIQLDSFELAKYLIKCSILDYRFQHPKTISVKQTNLGKSSSMLSPTTANFGTSAKTSSSIHSSSSMKSSSSSSFNQTHSRNPSGSSIKSDHSASSYKSSSSNKGGYAKKETTPALQDPFQVLTKVKTSRSKLFPKFAEKLRHKLRQDLSSTKIFTDPQLRKMIDLFLNELDDHTIERIDRDARIEGILTLFINCASKTLEKMGSNNGLDRPKEISTHTNSFLKYLIMYVKKSARGFISSSRSALLDDLMNYSESFGRNSRLEPSKTVFTSEPQTSHHGYSHKHHSSFSSSRRSSAYGSDSLKPTVSSSSTLYPSKSHSPKPTYSAPQTVNVIKKVRNDDISMDPKYHQIVYIAEMLEVSPDVVPDLVNELFLLATDTASLTDLRKCTESTHSGNHPCYTSDLFLTPEDYFKWSAEELKKLDKDMKSIKDKAPYLNEEPQVKTENLNTVNYTYIPPSPVKNFHDLALYLLEYEFNSHYAARCEKTKYGDFLPFDFSPDAHAVLGFVKMFWRLNTTTMGVIFLLESKRLQEGGLFSHDFLVDSVYPFIVSEYLEPNRSNTQNWTRYEKAVSYKAMSDVLEQMLNTAVQRITIDDYSSTIATFQRLNNNITSYIQPYSTFDGLPPLTISDNLELAFKEQISTLVANKFDEQALTYYPDVSEFHLEPFSLFVRAVYDTLSGFRKNFKDPLFGFNIRKMMIRLYLREFFFFCNKLIPIIPLDLELETGEPFGSEDIRILIDNFSSIAIAYEKTNEKRTDMYENGSIPQQNYQTNTRKDEEIAEQMFDELRNGLNPSLKSKFDSEVSERLARSYKQLMSEDYEDLVSNGLDKQKLNAQELMLQVGSMKTSDKEQDTADSSFNINSLNITNTVFNTFSLFHKNLDIIGLLGFAPDTSADLSLSVMTAISHVLCDYSNHLNDLVRKELKEGEQAAGHSNSSGFNEPDSPSTSKKHMGTQQLGYQDKWSLVFNSLMVQSGFANSNEQVMPHMFHKETAIKINNLFFSMKKFSEFSAGLEEINSILHDDADGFSFIYQPKTAYFEIILRRGKDLKPTDRNNLSDPYVIFKHNNKIISQSKTVYNTLNPIWDEKFEVTQPADDKVLSLGLTLWDENKWTKDTVCGKKDIDLDPKTFNSNQPIDLWVTLDNGGKVLLDITLVIEQKDNIVYQYNKCLKKLYQAYGDIFSQVTSKFETVIKYYISQQTMIGFFQKYSSTDAPSYTQDDIAAMLDPLFDYLNENLRLFWNILIPEAMNKLLLDTWNIFLDALLSIGLPEVSQTNSKEPLVGGGGGGGGSAGSSNRSGSSKSRQPLDADQCKYVLVIAEMLLYYCHHDGKGVSREVLWAVPKHQFLVRLLTLEYDMSGDEIEELCQIRKVTMDRIKCAHDVSSLSLNQTPVDIRTVQGGLQASRNLKPLSIGDLERVESKYGTEFDLNEMEIMNYLRLLRIKGRNQFVEDMLMSIN